MAIPELALGSPETNPPHPCDGDLEVEAYQERGEWVMRYRIYTDNIAPEQGWTELERVGGCRECFYAVVTPSSAHRRR